MNDNRTDRGIIFKRVQAGLASVAPRSFPMPDTGKAFFRATDGEEKEIDLLLSEVVKTGGRARRIRGSAELAAALAELVKNEPVKTAAVSGCGFLKEQRIEETLKDLNVEILRCEGAGHNLSACDVGIVAADAVLPETGTVLLRTRPEQPQALSLLPRICLVLAAPSALRRDLHDAFALAGGDSHFVLVSGPSRTADIEKILTLGVHGPKFFHLWVCW
ncbi:MAG: LUD domain-containing protein [Syntrophales bacterium]|nr:LUD domain-containing protein [Syntrophales bacterium]